MRRRAPAHHPSHTVWSSRRRSAIRQAATGCGIRTRRQIQVGFEGRGPIEEYRGIRIGPDRPEVADAPAQHAGQRESGRLGHREQAALGRRPRQHLVAAQEADRERSWMRGRRRARRVEALLEDREARHAAGDQTRREFTQQGVRTAQVEPRAAIDPVLIELIDRQPTRSPEIDAVPIDGSGSASRRANA